MTCENRTLNKKKKKKEKEEERKKRKERVSWGIRHPFGFGKIIHKKERKKSKSLSLNALPINLFHLLSLPRHYWPPHASHVPT